MTKHLLALRPACPPVSFEHGFTAPQPVGLQLARGLPVAALPILDPLVLAPVVLAPLVLALPVLPLPVLAPLVLAPLVFAQPIQRWLQPLALRGVGLAAEGIAVFGLGLGAVAVMGPAAALPGPAVVALGYMTMLLLLGGVLKPADGARTGLALRVLASAFVCMALAAGRSPLGP